ncbi:kinesin-like protein KIN-7O isoform X1 [Nicotiana tabacum]|uniref:Kinesin-like protein KIN-7O isoform X1 n=1 Tax=Nicotiana tabacum TaxID=4097 RepID=A0AC58U548_TOBAC
MPLWKWRRKRPYGLQGRKLQLKQSMKKQNLIVLKSPLLSQKMTEVKNELESCRMQCKLLEERLVVSENNVRLERSFSEEKLLEIDQLRLGLRVAEEQCKRSQEISELVPAAYCRFAWILLPEET